MLRLLGFFALAISLFAQIGTQHETLNRDFTSLSNQAANLSDDQLAARISGYSASYGGLAPLAGGFTAGDYQYNRDLARRNLAWLALLESRAYRHPGLARSIAGFYGVLGDFYTRPAFRSYGFPSAALYGYAGAGRLYRRLWLGGYGNFQTDFERYATHMAVLGGAWGYYPGYYQYRKPEGLDAVDLGPVEDTGRKPVAVPKVDTSKLTEAQKALWDELRPQFTITATRVHEAMVNLDALAQRLRRQGMDVNATDRAYGYQMEGFLADAADLIQAGDFEQAKKALDRARYVRERLKAVVGG